MSMPTTAILLRVKMQLCRVSTWRTCSRRFETKRVTKEAQRGRFASFPHVVLFACTQYVKPIAQVLDSRRFRSRAITGARHAGKSGTLLLPQPPSCVTKEDLRALVDENQALQNELAELSALIREKHGDAVPLQLGSPGRASPANEAQLEEENLRLKQEIAALERALQLRTSSNDAPLEADLEEELLENIKLEEELKRLQFIQQHPSNPTSSTTASTAPPSSSTSPSPTDNIKSKWSEVASLEEALRDKAQALADLRDVLVENDRLQKRIQTLEDVIQTTSPEIPALLQKLDQEKCQLEHDLELACSEREEARLLLQSAESRALQEETLRSSPNSRRPSTRKTVQCLLAK